MMEFIDTHAHIYDEAFSEDADLAIARAVEAGVTKIVLPDIEEPFFLLLAFTPRL